MRASTYARKDPACRAVLEMAESLVVSAGRLILKDKLEAGTAVELIGVSHNVTESSTHVEFTWSLIGSILRWK